MSLLYSQDVCLILGAKRSGPVAYTYGLFDSSAFTMFTNLKSHIADNL